MRLSRPITWIHRKNIANDDNRIPNENQFFIKKKYSITPYNWLSLRGFKVSKIILQTLNICLSAVLSQSTRFESYQLTSRSRGRSGPRDTFQVVVYNM